MVTHAEKNKIIPNINHMIPSRNRGGTGPQGTVVSAFLLRRKVFSVKCGGQSRKVIRSVVWKGHSDHQIGKWKPLTVAGVRTWSSYLEEACTAPLEKHLRKQPHLPSGTVSTPAWSQRSPYTCIPQGIDKNVCSSLTHRSPELETTQRLPAARIKLCLVTL